MREEKATRERGATQRLEKELASWAVVKPVAEVAYRIHPSAPSDRDYRGLFSRAPNPVFAWWGVSEEQPLIWGVRPGTVLPEHLSCPLPRDFTGQLAVVNRPFREFVRGRYKTRSNSYENLVLPLSKAGRANVPKLQASYERGERFRKVKELTFLGCGLATSGWYALWQENETEEIVGWSEVFSMGDALRISKEPNHTVEILYGERAMPDKYYEESLRKTLAIFMELF